jgi:hypothetical protein
LFQHFLLTRMNTAAPFGEPNACLNEDWLQHRFALFERYTLPSVQAQARSQGFQWLLFSHQDTPTEFRERLVQYSRACTEIEIVACTEFDEEVQRKEVLSRLRVGTTHVVTSRVDNDDALGQTFLSAVQREFRGQAGEFINFDIGYQLKGGRLYTAEHHSNPYCSAIEARTNFVGVFGVSHMDIHQVYPVRHVRDRRRWLTVIHDRNALNQVDGQRCTSRELAGEFGWLLGLEFQDSWWPVTADVVGRQLQRIARRALTRKRAETAE